MSTKLDIPDDLAEGVRLRAAEEGRRLDETAVDLLRRKRIADKFLTGEWGLELAGFEEGRIAGPR